MSRLGFRPSGLEVLRLENGVRLRGHVLGFEGLGFRVLGFRV